jgi:DMSO/TMAO reductase YedYZ molybdopterin-dependent catalytic subunit
VRGAAAGGLAGLAAGLLLCALRFAGVPLAGELLADRFLPLLPVDTFLRVLGWLGGPRTAKELAFAGSVVGPALAGALVGAAFARSALPRRWLVLVAAVLAGGLLAVTWPVLGASYAGLPPGPARVATGAAIVAAVALAAGLLAALGPAAGAGKGTGRPRAASPGRRRLVLAGLGGLLALATGGLALRLQQAGAFDYDGTRLLAVSRQPITPAAEFYVVTKNLIDPEVDHALWRLEVTGAVERPFTLTLSELRALSVVTRETTLECISNGAGYGLLSNARWTGVPMGQLLDRSGPMPGTSSIAMQGVDGYVHTLDLRRAREGGALVAVDMNGAPLGRRHGAPARVVVPGAYGEVSVKWLTRVTVLDHPEQGYYESQGWRAGFVHTTSVIDLPPHGQRLPAGRSTSVRGAAYAGDRGVSRVELSTDGGRTWAPARIDYTGSPAAWVLWSAPWTPAAAGTRTLVVRAYDGGGAVQEAARHGFAPAGATGLHSVEVTIG